MKIVVGMIAFMIMPIAAIIVAFKVAIAFVEDKIL